MPRVSFDPAEHLARFRDQVARHRFVNWTLSVHTRVDIDVTAADRYLAESGLARLAPPVTREHLWLCAAARVIRERPLFNCTYDGFRGLAPREDIHLRVTLARPQGLGRGILQHADRLDPAGMARALEEARARATEPWMVEAPPRRRPGRLGRLADELAEVVSDYAPHLESALGAPSGHDAGTFDVVNAGAFGAEDLHLLVLRPAVAALVVMAPREDVVRGPAGPVVRVRVPMAVPFCHKVMDTDAAAYFLLHLQQLLDEPATGLAGEGGA
jgi:pyruvate/2-oxoglutarate dehydrogenase complex dihydrolipoamide acyltransferase (E2) component